MSIKTHKHTNTTDEVFTKVDARKRAVSLSMRVNVIPSTENARVGAGEMAHWRQDNATSRLSKET